MSVASRSRAVGADVRIGNEVRARRLLIGVTQGALGEALGVSFQQVQKYEKGTNRISASRLSQIAAALDVPVTQFYEAAAPVADHGAEARDGTASGEVMDGALAGERLRLSRAFARIADPLVRRRLLDLAESLAENGRP